MIDKFLYNMILWNYIDLQILGHNKKLYNMNYFSAHFGFYLDVPVSSLCVVYSANQKVREGIFGQIPLQIFHKL